MTRRGNQYEFLTGTRIGGRGREELTSISPGQRGVWACQDLNLGPHPYQAHPWDVF
jgi:hypothetical protein